MFKTDCIAAIATARGTAGVGIVRLSGVGALDVVDKIFKPIGLRHRVVEKGREDKASQSMENRVMTYGEILCDGFMDKGLCVVFRTPHSYTGEDMVEFHCHGGLQIVNGVLQSVLRAGARMAEPGEYTRRAFMNGKMDLSSAEGVADMIHAQSLAETQAAGRLLGGELRKTVEQIQGELTDCLAQIEVMLDYPEEDIPDATRVELMGQVQGMAVKLEKLAETYQMGRKLKEGISIVLAGRTNVGKSSLLNRLLGFERAIVTDVDGTTRDIVEGDVEWAGVRITFSDTAGLRETTDKVESLGIEKTREAIGHADLVIYVCEGNTIDIENSEVPYIVVRQKADMYTYAPRENEVVVSAKTGEGIDHLRKVILDKIDCTHLTGALVLTNERHYDAIKRAVHSLRESLRDMLIKPFDLIALDLRASWDELGEVTGVSTSEDIIDVIFSKFCLGK